MGGRKVLRSTAASLIRLWRNQPCGVNEEIVTTPEWKANKYFRKGRAEMRAGNPAAAEKELSLALSWMPSLADAVAARAEVLDVQGKREDAQAEYERARGMRAKIRSGTPDRSYLFRRLGHPSYESEAYDFARTHKSGSVLLFVAHGNALFIQDHAAEALDSYERALQLKPGAPEIMALKGEALSIMGRYKEAVRVFDSALSSRPNDTEIISGRAIARMGLGHVADANADWRRQYDLLFEEHAAARACVALRMADYKAALPEIERALTKQPTDPYWCLYYLTARRRLGMSGTPIEVPSGELWPLPLLALHTGRMGEQQVLSRADTASRRAEAAFQLAVLRSGEDYLVAAGWLREVVEYGAPALIEYAAARNELSRFSK